MTTVSLLEEHHVVRYIKPSFIRKDGTIDGGAFVLRKRDSGISVNWLEFFRDSDTSESVGRIRKLIRMELRKNGRFAKLSVGATKSHVFKETTKMGTVASLDFVKKPLSATAEYEADLSHAEIVGVPNEFDSELVDDLAMFVGQSIARCVKLPLYPAHD